MAFAASSAPAFTIEAVSFFERDVRLRMPFRFGVVTLTEAPQAFAHVRIRLSDGRVGEGMAAELLAPKWFDKNPALSNEDNFDQLRRALQLARTLYLGAGTPATAFGHFERHYRAQVGRGAANGLNALVASYGPALVDKAVVDALGRALGLPFHELVRTNAIGLRAGELTPDLAGFDLDAFAATLKPAARLSARHTVGLVDPIVAADQTERVGDGLPETLEEVVASYGQRWFKLKVGGQVEADVARLVAIAGVLDRLASSGEGYRCTLDGNEQYDSVEGVVRLWQAMAAEPRLARLCEAVAFIEQPIRRAAALAEDVRALARFKPVIIDESDDSLDAFARARSLGYSGVSSKTCKGLYKSLLNRARCARWNAEAGSSGELERGPFLMSGEDLTIQAGLALQQDLALVGLLGITHIERNGHHYVNGMAGLPVAEQQSFLEAHRDLYERSHGAVRLRIRDGFIECASLAAPPGFASRAWPERAAMRPMKAA
ncbi:MAG: mandelate racemase [Rubrivivax sp.]|nr:mandelate racemase [Rubrivivax sp.]